MKTILIILKKEFLQIKRNRQMLPIIFVVPIFQLLVLVNAATFEISHINLTILDQDKSTFSKNLIEDFSASGYFRLINSANSFDDIDNDILRNEARAAIVIPDNFEKNILTQEKTSVQFLINAEDGAAAGVINSYSSIILFSYIRNIIDELGISQNSQFNIETEEQNWYNPEMNYKYFMVPGILGVLVTIIGFILCGMNIVREKELGTIEQLNVTPIKKYHFILGKLIPFWLIGLFDLALGLTIAGLVYSIQIEGSLLLLFFMASIYLVIVLSGGLLISTISNTQQQALFISFFFIVLIILMSGLFTPLDSMPKWAQSIAFFNPFSHFVEIMRRVMLKGAGFYEILDKFLILLSFAVLLLSFAIIRYRKTS